MKRITIQIIFMLLFSNGNLYGQTNETKQVKNSLYTSGDTQLFYTDITLNYERIFHNTTVNDFPLSIAGKFSFGRMKSFTFGTEFLV